MRNIPFKNQMTNDDHFIQIATQALTSERPMTSIGGNEWAWPTWT